MQFAIPNMGVRGDFAADQVVELGPNSAPLNTGKPIVTAEDQRRAGAQLGRDHGEMIGRITAEHEARERAEKLERWGKLGVTFLFMGLIGYAVAK